MHRLRRYDGEVEPYYYVHPRGDVAWVGQRRRPGLGRLEVVGPDSAHLEVGFAATAFAGADTAYLRRILAAYRLRRHPARPARRGPVRRHPHRLARRLRQPRHRGTPSDG